MSKNHFPTSYHEAADRCPSCGKECNIDLDLDEHDYCNNCRPKSNQPRQQQSSVRDSEKWLERALVREVKAAGGKAVKFSSVVETSWPDRLVLMPGQQVYWVELKSKGKKQTPRQQLVAAELSALGFFVYMIDTEEKLNEFVRSLTK